jgi:hypothetical protein
VPPQIHVSGPAHCYYGSHADGGDVVASYLGTCERDPDIQILTYAADEIRCDVRGKVPVGFWDAGDHAYIRLDLTRWDEAVYIKAAGSGGASGGTIGGANVGRALVLDPSTGGWLWVVPTTTAPPGTFTGENGYRFMGVILESHTRTRMGLGAMLLGLVFHAIGEMNSFRGGWQLYLATGSFSATPDPT